MDQTPPNNAAKPEDSLLSSETTAPAHPPARPAFKPKVFQCPSCAGSTTLRATGSTITAVCQHCSSVIDVSNENFQIVQKSSQAQKPTLLELGIRGKLKGVTWEVVGYTLKSDGTGQYLWDEYLLYNPYHGFRFLVQAMGHWSFVKVLREYVPGTGNTRDVEYDGQDYAIFLTGHAKVRYVKGEFYWRVKRDEITSVADYIAPPFMLSMEKNHEEINVSLGEYLQPKEVAAAFNIKYDMPRKIGVAPNQPTVYPGGRLSGIWFVTLLAIAAAFMVQFISVKTSDNVQISSSTNVITDAQKGQTLTSASFSLPEDQAVTVRSSSPVKNNWVELSMSLVNEQTNEEYSTTRAIEYYYGVDGGESWSEGSQRDEITFPKVPKGNYRLLVDVDTGDFKFANSQVQLTLDIWRDVPNWSNMVITILLLCIYPIFASMRRFSFESRRWADSDYAPSIYSSDES